MRSRRTLLRGTAVAAAGGLAACVAIGLGAVTRSGVVLACSAANCPVVVSTSPSSVDTDAGAAMVRIFGEGFTGATAVFLEPEDQPVTFLVITAEEADATVPAHAQAGDHWFVIQTRVGSSQAAPPGHVRIVHGPVPSVAGGGPAPSLQVAPSVAATSAPSLGPAAGATVSPAQPSGLPWLYILGLGVLALACGTLAWLRFWARSEMALRLLRRRASAPRRLDRNEEEIFDDRVRRL